MPETYGQLSPPGLDGAKLVSWGAMGVNQRFSKRWSTTVYVGGSAQSDPDNLATFNKPAIFVLNQETLYQFNSPWQLALCTSLRFQALYEEDAPYQPRDPPWRKEIRYYLRLFYRYQKGATAWSYSFRPEYRTFYALNGEPWSTPLQVRIRFKGQANIAVNDTKTNLVVIANEFLFATSKEPSQWSSLGFTEDRLSTFFRHVFKKPDLFLDLGLMHQLAKDEGHGFHYTTYLSFDMLFQNPFGRIGK